MQLKALILENFRGYRDRTQIEIAEGLTAFIGRNDFGKSSILDALNIFFGNVKIEADDASKHGDPSRVLIGCVFDDLPETLIIDEAAETTLQDEFLINENGFLEIHKYYDCTKTRISDTTYIRAVHPHGDSIGDLLSLRNSDLKERAKDRGIDISGIDRRLNTNIRRTIWNSVGQNNLDLTPKLIQVDKEDAKRVWDQISRYLPTFALFKSDRPSTDADSEVQDPMKLAVEEAIGGVEDELQRIEDEVRAKATEVARRTLQKLGEVSPELARDLRPVFSKAPNWPSLFKLSLTDDNEIPVNKRGSGIRRLILLSFFRAEAERRAAERDRHSIIYAIEEPETSQHPSNQLMLIEALLDLASQDNCQVLVTTHVPALTRKLPLESIRHVTRVDGQPLVVSGNEGEDVYDKVAEELGVLPDLDHRIPQLKVIVYVEGPNDVDFLCHISRIIHQAEEHIPDLSEDPRVAVIPVGGSALEHWVRQRYLQKLGLPEVHIYDSDREENRVYCEEVLKRDDRSCAFLTGKSKPTIESYLHPRVINEYFGIKITFSDIEHYEGEIPRLIVDTLRKNRHNKFSQEICIGSGSKKSKESSKVKKLLNSEIVQRMTCDMLRESDPDDDIRGWLRRIAVFLNA